MEPARYVQIGAVWNRRTTFVAAWNHSVGRTISQAAGGFAGRLFLCGADWVFGRSHLQMRKGLLLLMGTGLLWGTIGISGRLIFERSDLNAFQVSWLRTMFATPFCLLVGWKLVGPK